MLIREPFVVPANLPDNRVLTYAIRALVVMLAQAPVTRQIMWPTTVVNNSPLMIAVVAHKVYAWKVQLSVTDGTACDMEHPGFLRV